MKPPVEVVINVKIVINFVFKGAPDLLGGLMYHMTSLSVRSTVVHVQTFHDINRL